MPCDITSETEIRNLHKSIVEKYGRIDAAINSAGIAHGISSLVHTNMNDFNFTMQTNVTAVFISMQEQIKAMLQQEPSGGHIINLTSIYGVRGCPWGSSYSASKHAIIGLTRSAALEMANQGIYINAIAPGITPTGMIDGLGDTAKVDESFAKIVDGLLKDYPVERFGTPDQIAKAVMYLLECNWVTGTVMQIDGGWEAGKAMPMGLKCTAEVI